MGERISNVNKMMQNPKQRNMYLTVIALVVITLGAGFWFANKNSKTSQAQSGAVLSTVPAVQVAVGTSDSPEYNKQVAAANKDGAQKALDQGKTFVATPSNTNALTDRSVLDMIEKENQRKKDEAKAKADADQLAEGERLRKEEQAKAVAIVTPPPAPVVVAVPVVQPKPNKYGYDDYMLIATLSGAWKNKAPASEFDYARDKSSANNANNANSMNPSSNNQNAQMANSGQAVQPAPLSKAGTVMNAVLETEINSDEPSPVLARIVSGELKGTRLIGQIGQVGEKVVVQFSTANIPGLPNSVKISAVAVDPNSSRTALASDVDRHYFKKYGIMFAAAFLGGYADAIGQSNRTTIIDPSGGATVVQGQLTPKDINRQALGSVGKAIATSTQKETENLKPTITVNSGIAVGILLMDDLVIR